MNLESIFELVRKEDVVLWAGSGLSLYAGYPNGQQLSELIYKSLSKSEKDEVMPTLQLSDLAEEYVRMKGGSRNSLITLLKNALLKQPQSKKWHEVLSNIPQIKTIITTNYDNLFELAYKDQIHPIISKSDIAYRDGKTELFKVHGDIMNPDSILITKTDYEDFFRQRTNENIIWSVIKERISNKTILFIGYDLEDGNIKNILKEISDALGNNRKEIFLVAPNLKEHKVRHLHTLGVKYLDFKGEVFIEKLYKNIKKNITTDFSKQNVSPETLRKFLDKNNIQFELSSSDKGYHISSLKGFEGSGKLQLGVRNESEVAKLLKDFSEGKKFGKLSIDDKSIESFQMVLNDINMIGDNVNNYRLLLTSIPANEGLINVVFTDGSEFEDISYKLYKSDRLLQLSVICKGCEFSTQIHSEELAAKRESVDGYFYFTPTETFRHVNDAITVYKLFLCIAKGLGFTGYPVNGKKFSVDKFGIMSIETERIESNLDFFESLKKVERLYGVKFSNISAYSELDFDNVYKAITFADGQHYIGEWDEELTWELNASTPIELIKKLEDGAALSIEATKAEELTIYDQKITLGFLVSEPLELYITNLDEIQMQKTSLVKVRSRSKKIRLYYKKESRGVHLE